MSTHLPQTYGAATLDMVHAAHNEGIEQVVLFLRHSARTFDPNIHDLLNPLTDEGRALCHGFGRQLPQGMFLRGYASPPERCMDTAGLAIESYVEAGGSAGRTRAVEGLGVFYALDQRKMWKGLQQASSLASYVGEWAEGQVPVDAMMPFDVAAAMLLRALVGKLNSQTHAQPQLDLCVSHDISVYMLRQAVGLESVAGPPVEFLDGLLLFKRDGKYWMRSQHGGEVEIDVEL